MTDGYHISAEDALLVEKMLREGITDAYRYGIGAAIETIQKYRGGSVDVESFDRVIDDLRRQSAGADGKP